jgi:hypothetical protein
MKIRGIDKLEQINAIFEFEILKASMKRNADHGININLSRTN